MLTRCLSVSLASSLHSIPGATCSHSGSGPLPRRGRHGLFPRHLGDAKRKTSLQRSRRTQHISGPGDEPIDHRAETLQLALAARARSDMRFGGSRFARRQYLSGVRARYLALLAGVQARAWAHTPNTSNPSIGPRGGGGETKAVARPKDGPAASGIHKLTVSKYFLRLGRTCRRPARPSWGAVETQIRASPLQRSASAAAYAVLNEYGS
jgi:hypothetical protein